MQSLSKNLLHFHRTRTNISKIYIGLQKDSELPKQSWVKEQSLRHNPLRLQAILGNYSHESNSILEQKQTYVSMDRVESPEIIPQVYGCVWSCFSHVRLFATPWTVAHQAPLPMDSAGKNTGMGCHALFQGIFLTQGLNPRILHL